MKVVNDTFVRQSGSSYLRWGAVNNIVNLNWNISFFDADTLSHALYAFNNLLFIDTANWDVSSIRDFSFLFTGCFKLQSLNVTNWNMSSAVNLSHMFSGCSNLQSLNVANWNLHSAKDLSNMFYSTKIQDLNLFNWNISRANNLSWFLSGTQSWNIPNNWNISSVTNLYYAFSSCFYDTEILDFSDWKTNSLDCIDGTFFFRPYLKILNVTNWNTSSVFNMRTTFANCYNLTDLDVLNWNTRLLTNMCNMCRSDVALCNINISKWNLSYVTNMRNAFFACDGLKSNPDSLKSIAQALLTATNVPSTDKNLFQGNSMGPLYGCQGIINNTSVGTDLVAQLRAAGWIVSG